MTVYSSGSQTFAASRSHLDKDISLQAAAKTNQIVICTACLIQGGISWVADSLVEWYVQFVKRVIKKLRYLYFKIIHCWNWLWYSVWTNIIIVSHPIRPWILCKSLRTTRINRHIWFGYDKSFCNSNLSPEEMQNLFSHRYGTSGSWKNDRDPDLAEMFILIFQICIVLKSLLIQENSLAAKS